MNDVAQRPSYKMTFAVLVVGVSAYALLQSLVIPALPTIELVMHTNQNTVTWVVSAYLLSASVFTPIMGRIGDMVGKERMLVVTLIALSIGSVVAALAHTILILIIGRVIQGIGGGVLPLSFGIIRDEFPKEKLATAIGTIAAMTAVGGGLGLVIAGPIISLLGFHWLFWFPLILTGVAATMSHRFVPESPVRTQGRVSWLAALTLSAWLVALLLAVSEAPSWGWGSSKVIALFALGVLFLIIWIVVETKVRTPLIDMTMMRIHAVWTNNLVSFLFGVGLYSVVAFLPEFVQTPKSSGYGLGVSAVGSGLFLIPLTAGMFLLGLYSGRISAKYGSKMALLVGSGIMCVGFIILAVAKEHVWQIYVVSTVVGIGLGLGFSAMSNLIVVAVPPSQTGVASGINANIRTMGGAIGAGVMSSIVTSKLLTDGAPVETGYTRGFIFLAVVAFLATVAAIFIPNSKPDGEAHLAHAELALIPGGTITEG